LQAGFNASVQNEYSAEKREAQTFDEDQATYLRAKRRVDTLAKAKRLEKQIGAKK
jgi:hypothetical protein